MKIPSNYDPNAVDYERIQPGGHKCIIKEVVETKSQKGKEMLVISFDTTEEDTQPMYYTNRYVGDTRPDKKWPGNMYIVTEGEYAAGNINKFLGAVEKSNDNFHPAKGGELDVRIFKNLKVGIVFREEEYTNQGGEIRTSVKGFRWCAYDKAPEQSAPEPKLLHPQDALGFAQTATANPQLTPSAGFFDVPAGADETEGLPFK